MKELSKEQFKERAKHLRQILLEKHKIDLPHGHALEVLAKVFGFKDWNTASALTVATIKEKPVAVQAATEVNKELPPAAKFKTAGEYVDFFSKFDRETKVVVHEYEERDLSHFGTMTSVCSLTFDSEIQNDTELRLELNTEEERDLQLDDFGKSRKQTFEPTPSGRYQRVIKWFNMQNGFWNPKNFDKHVNKS
jgi:hypothetical protein